MEIKCIVIDDEDLARDYTAKLLNQIPNIRLLGSYENAMDALEIIDSGQVQVVFSDIRMPGLSGIDLLKRLESPPLFVFVTSHTDYAAQSFELDVFDYLVKPFTLERLLKTVNKALREITKTDKNFFDQYLAVKDRRKTVLVRYGDIYYLEGAKDYVNIYAREKLFTKWGVLKSVEALLDPMVFVRVQKSYIINITHLHNVDAKSVRLHHVEKEIPLGLHYRDHLFSLLNFNP